MFSYNFIKKETLAQVFSCEFCETSKSTSFYRTPPATASDHGGIHTWRQSHEQSIELWKYLSLRLIIKRLQRLCLTWGIDILFEKLPLNIGAEFEKHPLQFMPQELEILCKAYLLF